MLALFLQFTLAHLLGDFLFQPGKWITDKEKKKHKSPYLYWHIAIHFVLLILILQFDFQYWLGILIVIITHYVIDLLKLLLNEKINSRILFFGDQLLHLLAIYWVVSIYKSISFDFSQLYSTENLLAVTFVLLATYVSSVVIKILLSKWKMLEDTPNNAGKYIGILERLFIFSFITMGYWEGIGFLLAAKSVFRFGDLSKAEDRNLTEYILIGTLLSFGLAILIAVCYNRLAGIIHM